MSGKWSDRLNVFVNVLVVVFIFFLLLRPDGLLGSEVRRWRQSSSTRREIQKGWAELAGSGQRVSVAAGPGRTLIEFADYQCPACRQTHAVLPELTRQTGATLLYRHFPLTTIHPSAEGAARAAICAEEQGRFPQMHEHLYTTESWFTNPKWEDEARAVGVPDIPRFTRCLTSDATRRRLAQDRALADRLGIHATPTFVARGGTVAGLPTAAALQRIVR
ncbi:MAG TPA: DsbA family protein [Longimicrobium sp.]|nr:DsbA family protein [Longimicrobium sp.]